MQHTLEEFLRALRAADVRVSPAEAIDAARTAVTVGYADRELFKDALCATLAKSREEVARFDETFERFFSRDALSLPPPPEPREGEGSPADDAAAAESPLAQMLLQGDAAAVAQAMEAAAERAGVAEIRLSTQRSRMTRRLLDEMGLAEIEQIIAAARKQAEGRALAERLDARRKALVAEAQGYVERQHSLYAAGSARSLREEMLA